MTEPPESGRLDSSHLIERAARRLQEAGDAGAAGLLPANGVTAFGTTPLPGRPLPPPPGPSARVNGFEHPPSAPPRTPGDAAMPEIDQAMLERAGMIDWTKHRQRMSEEFRIIQGQLAQAMAGTVTKGNALPNLIMITSARPGEGKTFTSINLAGSLARYASRPVILVDMDSSRHTLSSRLGQERMAGLLDLAVDPRLPIGTVIRPTSMSGLSLLPIGGLDGVRAVLSASTPIIDVVERLARQFASSTIILDAPPCLSSSDPSTLAHLVGQAVMLVEAQRTQRSEVEAALDLIDACPTVSLILTKVKLTVSDTFGAYGYY